MNKYLLIFGILAFASRAFAGDVTVSQAWARATAPGQDNATLALHIISTKNADIVSASSLVAKAVEIHSMIQEDGMMKMKALDIFPLKANQEAILGGGGFHLMLVGLKKPLKVGESVPLMLTIQFENKHREKLLVKATVISQTDNQ